MRPTKCICMLCKCILLSSRQCVFPLSEMWLVQESAVFTMGDIAACYAQVGWFVMLVHMSIVKAIRVLPRLVFIIMSEQYLVTGCGHHYIIKANGHSNNDVSTTGEYSNNRFLYSEAFHYFLFESVRGRCWISLGGFTDCNGLSTVLMSNTESSVVMVLQTRTET